MRASGWMGRAAFCAVLAAAAGATGCKTLNERYIALEVWKYERCFGHLPPGFVPPGPSSPLPRRPASAAREPPVRQLPARPHRWAATNAVVVVGA